MVANPRWSKTIRGKKLPTTTKIPGKATISDQKISSNKAEIPTKHEPYGRTTQAYSEKTTPQSLAQRVANKYKNNPEYIIDYEGKEPVTIRRKPIEYEYDTREKYKGQKKKYTPHIITFEKDGTITERTSIIVKEGKQRKEETTAILKYDKEGNLRAENTWKVNKTRSGAYQGMKPEKELTYDEKGNAKGTIRELIDGGQARSITTYEEGKTRTRGLSYTQEGAKITNPYTGEQEDKEMSGKQSWQRPGYKPKNLTKEKEKAWEYYHQGYGNWKGEGKFEYTGSKGKATGKEREQQLEEARLGRELTAKEKAESYYGKNAYADEKIIMPDQSTNYEETGRGQAWRKYLYKLNKEEKEKEKVRKAVEALYERAGYKPISTMQGIKYVKKEKQPIIEFYEAAGYKPVSTERGIEYVKYNKIPTTKQTTENSSDSSLGTFVSYSPDGYPIYTGRTNRIEPKAEKAASKELEETQTMQRGWGALLGTRIYYDKENNQYKIGIGKDEKEGQRLAEEQRREYEEAKERYEQSKVGRIHGKIKREAEKGYEVLWEKALDPYMKETGEISERALKIITPRELEKYTIPNKDFQEQVREGIKDTGQIMMIDYPIWLPGYAMGKMATQTILSGGKFAYDLTTGTYRALEDPKTRWRTATTLAAMPLAGYAYEKGKGKTEKSTGSTERDLATKEYAEQGGTEAGKPIMERIKELFKGEKIKASEERSEMYRQASKGDKIIIKILEEAGKIPKHYDIGTAMKTWDVDPITRETFRKKLAKGDVEVGGSIARFGYKSPDYYLRKLAEAFKQPEAIKKHDLDIITNIKTELKKIDSTINEETSITEIRAIMQQLGQKRANKILNKAKIIADENWMHQNYPEGIPIEMLIPEMTKEQIGIFKGMEEGKYTPLIGETTPIRILKGSARDILEHMAELEALKEIRSKPLKTLEEMGYETILIERERLQGDAAIDTESKRLYIQKELAEKASNPRTMNEISPSGLSWADHMIVVVSHELSHAKIPWLTKIKLPGYEKGKFSYRMTPTEMIARTAERAKAREIIKSKSINEEAIKKILEERKMIDEKGNPKDIDFETITREAMIQTGEAGSRGMAEETGKPVIDVYREIRNKEMEVPQEGTPIGARKNIFAEELTRQEKQDILEEAYGKREGWERPEGKEIDKEYERLKRKITEGKFKYGDVTIKEPGVQVRAGTISRETGKAPIETMRYASDREGYFELVRSALEEQFKKYQKATPEERLTMSDTWLLDASTDKRILNKIKKYLKARELIKITKDGKEIARLQSQMERNLDQVDRLMNSPDMWNKAARKIVEEIKKGNIKTDLKTIKYLKETTEQYMAGAARELGKQGKRVIVTKEGIRAPMYEYDEATGKTGKKVAEAMEKGKYPELVEDQTTTTKTGKMKGQKRLLWEQRADWLTRPGKEHADIRVQAVRASMMENAKKLLKKKKDPIKKQILAMKIQAATEHYLKAEGRAPIPELTDGVNEVGRLLEKLAPREKALYELRVGGGYWEPTITINGKRYIARIQGKELIVREEPARELWATREKYTKEELRRQAVKQARKKTIETKNETYEKLGREIERETRGREELTREEAQEVLDKAYEKVREEIERTKEREAKRAKEYQEEIRKKGEEYKGQGKKYKEYEKYTRGYPKYETYGKTRKYETYKQEGEYQKYGQYAKEKYQEYGEGKESAKYKKPEEEYRPYTPYRPIKTKTPYKPYTTYEDYKKIIQTEEKPEIIIKPPTIKERETMTTRRPEEEMAGGWKVQFIDTKGGLIQESVPFKTYTEAMSYGMIETDETTKSKFRLKKVTVPKGEIRNYEVERTPGEKFTYKEGIYTEKRNKRKDKATERKGYFNMYTFLQRGQT